MRGNAGFTLLELMVSAAILAFGIVMIYEALLTSVSVFGSYANFLNTRTWINEQVWEMQDRVNHSDIVVMGENRGELYRNNRDFKWVTAVEPIDPQEGLYAFRAQLFWNEGQREVTLSRSSYLVPARVTVHE